MQWAEVTVVTTQEATEAVANLFAEAGATGVVIDDPQLVEQYRQTGSWDYCDLPVSKETDVRVVGYLPVLPGLDDQLTALRGNIARLRNFLSDIGSGQISWRVVEDEDWANGWKRYYHPLRIGTRLVIKPSWEDYNAAPQDLIIELDPGMAFGTGTHATTTLCMEAVEFYIQPGMSVIDVGTGSGVLAITAAKLGAFPVLAVDLDPVAVGVAKENIIINKVDDQVEVLQGDLLRSVTQPADMVVANIVADIIIGMVCDVLYILKPHGIFIASGIIDERLEEVKTAILQTGLSIADVRQKEGWAVIIARKE
jgi:ribosomal protein L11 methyltransferase